MKEKTDIRLKARAKIKDAIQQNKYNQIDLVNRAITVLHDLNISVLNHYLKDETSKMEFKADISKQAVQTLFKKSISQIESILILIENGKYLEGYSVLRDLFENSIFLLYIVEYPFEAERWLIWAEMDFKEREEYKNKNKEFDNFKLSLKNNNYKELLKYINKKNYNHYRDFSVWFIREEAFKKHPSLKGSDFREFYFELCRFVHPSIRALNHNDKLSESHFNDIVADTLYITKNISGMYIDYFKDPFIDERTINHLLRIKEEINKNLKRLS